MQDVTIDGNSTSRQWIGFPTFRLDRIYLINLDGVSGALRRISFSVIISNYGRIVSNLSCRVKAQLFRHRVPCGNPVGSYNALDQVLYFWSLSTLQAPYSIFQLPGEGLYKSTQSQLNGRQKGIAKLSPLLHILNPLLPPGNSLAFSSYYSFKHSLEHSLGYSFYYCSFVSLIF